MDWPNLLAAWGPAAPLILFFLKSHYDMVYKVFPNAIEEIKLALRRQERRAEQRHDEMVKLQLRSNETLEEIAEEILHRRKTQRRPKRPASE